ncbi:MAG: efflux RND transporter periplasmic adaptor subunit [Bacteroidales bacterium]|jgi:RND family efflux transporter MFP subunit|nr:efflux RND transporter periplasmic adaptor subunit [Bacteroidales bacterium]HOO67650.1 efflux RND transporter periplasmic adaptor subunit [Bacteroidales bacterium]HPE23646.1 efflux RND transporter periplasmic adaptor subunit [Bacteroidales bacterium]HPJ06277.1 efflux RND transporter periplasmic adaptor subunit [Bacteroidales bacterium]HPQ64942.1 efflux RND transporter periplasmic adaptor subunit [Bacteroidales bacterium]
MNRTIFTLILAGGIVLASCAPKEKKAGAADAATADSVAAIPIKAMPVSKTKIARTIDYTSTILAYEEVNLAPSTPGRVDKIYVEVGDRVQKGQKLFLMDRTQYYANKIQLANLEKDLARLDTLLKVGSVKEQLYDQTKAQYEVMKTNVEFMEENTQLEAPFSGIITGKYLEDGELYSGAPGMSGKAAVVTLMQINPVKIIISISEQYFPLIKNGMKVRVAADVYPDKTFEGTIFRVHPTIDAMSRSFRAEVRISNGSELLRPGMFARAFIDMGQEEAFVVPASAVLLQEGTNERYIFVVENGVAVRKPVILGQRFDDRFEIAGGDLKEGDSLITDGQARLNNGQKVEISK